MPIHRHSVSADERRPQRRFEEREIVAQHQRHRVVFADAECGEARRGARGICLQRLPRQRPRSAQEEGHAVFPSAHASVGDLRSPTPAPPHPNPLPRGERERTEPSEPLAPCGRGRGPSRSDGKVRGD